MKSSYIHVDHTRDRRVSSQLQSIGAAFDACADLVAIHICDLTLLVDNLDAALLQIGHELLLTTGVLRLLSGLGSSLLLELARVTRAQERLYLTYARSRFRYGKSEPSVRSRFLDELDESLIRTESGSRFESRPDRFTAARGSGRSVVRDEYSQESGYDDGTYLILR